MLIKFLIIKYLVGLFVDTIVTFYKNPIDKSILYVDRNDNGYRIYVQDKDNSQTRQIHIGKLSDKNKEKYIQSSKDLNIESAGKISKKEISSDILTRLNKELNEPKVTI